MERELREIVARYHVSEPVDWRLQEIWSEEDDSRWVLFLTCPEGRYVIKLACNGFTTTERVTGWRAIIRAYGELGYYSPTILPSRSGRYAERVHFRGKACVLWEEEYARYPLRDALDSAVYTRPDGSYVYRDEVFACLGRVAQMRYCFFPHCSGWVRLRPFASGDEVDEVTDCVRSFDAQVRENLPQFLPRWERIYGLFVQNKTRLAEIYEQLPRSVFQGDPFGGNLLLDGEGHLKGFIDYNLAGEDTALNMFFSAVLFGYGGEAALLDTLRYLRQFYRFCEAEVRAAPFLYKYISCIEYRQLEALEQCAGDEAKLNRLFDDMERALQRDDLDFRSAMLGGLPERVLN